MRRAALRTTTAALRRAESTREPSFYACPTAREAMHRWTLVEGDVEGDAVAFALCRPNAESAMRAPWTTLWVEEEESEALPNACAVVRDAFPVVGSARGGEELSACVRAATREERDASGGAAVLVRRDRVRENPLMVDVYERRDALGTLMLKHAGRDLFDWLRERGVRAATSTAFDDAEGEKRYALVGPSDGFFQESKVVRTGDASTSGRQSSNACLMIAPSAFALNAHAARDNHFMDSTNDGMSALEIRERVSAEFKALYAGLRSMGVRISLFSHDSSHDTPDAVFPNNWHTLRDGKLKLFPMKDENRRRERREDIIEFLKHQNPNLVVDDSLLKFEKADPPKFLEGTGSLVIDHEARVAFVALSERAHEDVVHEHCKAEGLTPITFTSLDAKGRPIYHTNVMLSVCTSVAVVCAESIPDPDARRRVLDALSTGGRTVVDITFAQVDAFCGNVLEVRRADGAPALVASARAWRAFTPDQRRVLTAAFEDRIVSVDFDTIERVGGGGVRCAIAEHFL